MSRNVIARCCCMAAAGLAPVTLNVTFATFTDGKTSYAKTSVLDAPAKNLQVEIQNSGYRKLSP